MRSTNKKRLAFGQSFLASQEHTLSCCSSHSEPPSGEAQATVIFLGCKRHGRAFSESLAKGVRRFAQAKQTPTNPFCLAQLCPTQLLAARKIAVTPRPSRWGAECDEQLGSSDVLFPQLVCRNGTSKGASECCHFVRAIACGHIFACPWILACKASLTR